ncbi:HECT-domain-containing protein [Xylariales sp. AK1849]|nr:HECT-domain-containing protein [Xylariales sp. AK1849]
MASRSQRHPFQPPNATAPPRRTRPDPQFGDHLDVFRKPYSQQLPSDSSSDDDVYVSASKNPQLRQAQHSRSMSHPFPSLLTSKKPKKPEPEHDDPTHDDRPKRGQSNPHPNMASKKLPRAPADFSNGNCMTCGGLVRWPKELDIFRCTICLTINDLKPYTPKFEAEGPRRLSLEHARKLVQQSLRQSLRSFVAGKGRSTTPGALPNRSSSHASEDYFTRLDSPNDHDKTPSLGGTPPVHTHNPVFDDYVDVSFEPNPLNRDASTSRSYSTSHADARSSGPSTNGNPRQQEGLDPRKIFKSVEDDLKNSFGSPESINASFVSRRPSFTSKPQLHMQIKRKPVPPPQPEKLAAYDDALVSELDAKMLLLGDFAENAGWWTGGQHEAMPRSHSQRKDDLPSLVSSRSPRVDWGELLEWYHVIIDAAGSWTEIYDEAVQKDPSQTLSSLERRQFEASVLEAQGHLQRVLLKCTEMLLKRPGRLLKDPQDIRFLLLILVNPLLTAGHKSYSGAYQHSSKGKGTVADLRTVGDGRPTLGRHSGIIKRILGLLSNSSDQCHHQLVVWFSKLPDHLFLEIKDLIGSFINYRLKRQSERKVEPRVDVTAGLIPQMSSSRSGNTPASLHAALEASSGSRKQKRPPEPARLTYGDDWQLKAGAKIMALMFAANDLTNVRRNEVSVRHSHGHLLATSDFYNTMLDCLDFKTDFEMWESRRGKFSFCHYPFFLSIWAKIQILEFDAKRQMQGKAREAFFDSILSHKSYTQYLFLSVRRDCLIEDSLAKVSEVVGSGSEDIKKGLRIEFQGEEGVDAGGLKKEWFLLLVREVFNPDHGLFVFDEDSQYCYFNPHTFETSDQYFLVGVVLGLAIYNSTILDVALPPFAFRKLLAAAPAYSAGTSTHQRPTMTYTLDDLAEYRPRLAHGLRQLLEFDGDVESTFCLDFVIEIEKYGARVRVPLCPRGERMVVTNSNRREYVDLYVRYLLDKSVSRQFEPFKRGFFTVCAGNALSLFRPEEIELLVRGSDEPLDIASLRAVATYTSWDNSKSEQEPEHEPTVDWFWETFAMASPKDQRRLLSFITGSDRIPAMGAASLVIKINCLGNDTGRYPTARTCFNILNLYRYQTRERLEAFLWGAVHESEGFGLR